MVSRKEVWFTSFLDTKESRCYSKEELSLSLPPSFPSSLSLLLLSQMPPGALEANTKDRWSSQRKNSGPQRGQGLMSVDLGGGCSSGIIIVVMNRASFIREDDSFN